MSSYHIVLLLLASLAFIGVGLASELGDVFQSNGQSQASQSQSQPESQAELLSSTDFAKWKRGINLGRKMMCQIDHRNCGSFSEAKRFNQQPNKINYNVLAYMLKNFQNAEAMAPYVEDQ